MNNITPKKLNRLKLVKPVVEQTKPVVGFTQRAKYGWYAFVTGKPTYFGRTKADANEWIRSMGCDPVK